jgi:hypothetical protein
MEHIPLVLSALRGQTVPTSQVAKALWEVTGYGLSCTVGEPNGPLAMRGAELPSPVELDKAEAIARLERLSAAAAADDTQPQGMALGISRELLGFLLRYLADFVLEQVTK